MIQIGNTQDVDEFDTVGLWHLDRSSQRWVAKIAIWENEDAVRPATSHDDEFYARVGAGTPIKMVTKAGKVSTRYIDRRLDDTTFSLVDSPTDATCIKAGRHQNIRSGTYMEEWVRVSYLTCDTCGAYHTTGSYDEVEHAEAAHEFEDWQDHSELGTKEYDTGKMWGQ